MFLNKYIDRDPEYRAARVRSGIPPPSSRDQRRQPRQGNNDLSRFNPAMQRQQQRHQPYDQRQRDDNRHYQRNDDRYNQRYPEQRHHDSRYSEQRHQYSDRQHEQRYPEQPQPYPEQSQPYPDQRRHDHQQQQQQQQPKAKPLDMRTSTDFLKCENRLSADDLVQTIQLSEATPDLDFLSSKGLVEKVNDLRVKIRHVSNEQLSPARSKSNPFERIGNAIFMNRAATKLAALDATFGLTAGTEPNKEFQFADLCGGPGGFSEYLLWRIHSWGTSAHGYGITLKSSTADEVNWHTEKFRSDIPRHSLTQIDGVDGTGDLYKEENIRQFEDIVQKETKQRGVDLVVADGGFDFSGNEEQQEVLAQRLLLCEIITMLTSLKSGGHFVCKFFDILDEFTGDLVWLLYQCFDEICITKPLSSRPANSERYIVCKGLVYSHSEQLIKSLLNVSKSMQNDNSPKRFVPRHILEKDEDFIDYVKMRNMKFAMKQTEALEQLDQYIKNP